MEFRVTLDGISTHAVQCSGLVRFSTYVGKPLKIDKIPPIGPNANQTGEARGSISDSELCRRSLELSNDSNQTKISLWGSGGRLSTNK